jgi:ParB family chromosome partitioning protein
MLGIIENIDIHRIKHRPDFYRSASLRIEELATSIKTKGLLQPIIVRTKGDYFEIVAGNRRYLACKTLAWRKIICHVVDLDDKEAFEISLVENIQRKALNPMDEALAFKSYVHDFGWGGISDLAVKIGKSVSYVDKRIRLLDLPPEVLHKVRDSVINPTIAEELIYLNDKNKQFELAKMIQKNHLSSKRVRDLVKDYKDSVYDRDNITMIQEKIVDVDERVKRSFAKSIITLKIAMNNLCKIIEGTEDNWIIYEILMQHKNMLNSQIDLLIKEKKKIDNCI